MATIKVDGLLTGEDRRAIEEMLRWYKNIQHDKTQRPTPLHDLSETETTEAYIARTIEDGIPALEEAPSQQEKDRPGEALCEIYAILRKSTNYELWKVPSFKQRVFNLTTQDIPANEWVPILRDRFGRWLALRGGTGSGETGFWGRVDEWDCKQGVGTIVEQNKRPNGGFEDKPGGIISNQTFHCTKHNYFEGPLVQAGPPDAVDPQDRGTYCWVRPGYLPDEYIIDCPAGWTGVKQITVDVVCSNGQLLQLKWYFWFWNGQLTREPCVGNINICGPCSTQPFTPFSDYTLPVGNFGMRAVLALLGLATLAAGVLL